MIDKKRELTTTTQLLLSQHLQSNQTLFARKCLGLLSVKSECGRHGVKLHSIYVMTVDTEMSLTDGQRGYKARKMADATLNLQMKVRQNAEELQDILKDLNSWEDEMKTKDKELRNSKVINKQVWC